MKAVLRWKFTAMNAYIGKEDRSKINHVFHFRKQQKKRKLNQHSTEGNN
jgi:hypothetical protein